MSSTRFSWDSTESCFTGHLGKQLKTFFPSFSLCYENKVVFFSPLKHRPEGYLLRSSEAVSSLLVSRFGSAIFCSISSHGSRMLSIPVDVLPTEVFLLWHSSEKLDDREWHELYPIGEKCFGWNNEYQIHCSQAFFFHTPAIPHNPLVQ